VLYEHQLPNAPDAAQDLSHAIGLNCRLVASAVVEVEKLARDSPISRLSVPLYGARALGYDLGTLGTLLSELFLFVLAREVATSFVSLPVRPGEAPSITPPEGNGAVCLFSGGVDSYSGILRAAHTYESVTGVFCAHSDQAKMIALVRRLARRLRRRAIALEEVRVPSLGKRGYAQLRGFLYIVTAGSALMRSGSSTLLVTECGPTMFQPRFSPLDSVTMTTHPEIVRVAQLCLAILLGRAVSVETPHAGLTKAEVMAASPDKQGLRSTHSCISQRFGDHDGTCYGCIVRRLAALACGIDDVSYRRNPIWDECASGGNLLELLRFSSDLLINRDNLEDFQRRPMSAFGVSDLFRRFALDNLAAIHSVRTRGGRLRAVVRRMCEEVAMVVGSERLDARLAALRRRSASW
jgi:7-cyano-7-deazaguanine synthase in queuosine biosynthesis